MREEGGLCHPLTICHPLSHMGNGDKWVVVVAASIIVTMCNLTSEAVSRLINSMGTESVIFRKFSKINEGLSDNEIKVKFIIKVDELVKTINKKRNGKIIPCSRKMC